MTLKGPICCKAMIAQCLSCTAGQKLSEYCKIYPSTVGCPGNKYPIYSLLE